VKTEFLTLDQKVVLRDALLSGDDPKQYAKDVFNEIDRLENIIKSYELAMDQVKYTIDSTVQSKPKW